MNSFSEKDDEVLELKTDAKQGATPNPSRRKRLKRVGAGIAGAALTLYGLSELGVAPKIGRPPPGKGFMTYRTNPKNRDLVKKISVSLCKAGNG